ncbi:OmpA family protein [Vibrio gallaecicus]|uniref:OmpA family protein n=1 Tax=Vibrio gallaecicus TaxID=552386 RepID=A0ABV4NFB0_9VIBR
MSKLSKVAVALIAASGIASHASMAETYIGGKIGLGWLDSACATSANCEDDAIGAGIYTGFNFNEQVGLELSSDYLGNYETNFSKSGVNYKFDEPIIAISLAPKFSIPLENNFSLLFKPGLAYIAHAGETDVVPTLAFGAEKRLSDNFSFRVEYQYFNDFDDKIVQDMNANFLSVGLSYYFGAAAPVAAAAAVTQAPAEPVVEPAPVVEAPKPVIVTKAQKGSYTQELFATNSAELSVAGEQTLEPLLTILLAHPESNIEIVGHTDSTGSEKYNQMISEKRANAVATYFEENGVATDRISASGEGESNPIASNATAEGRSQNRRVETNIPSFEYKEEVMK